MSCGKDSGLTSHKHIYMCPLDVECSTDAIDQRVGGIFYTSSRLELDLCFCFPYGFTFQ